MGNEVNNKEKNRGYNPERLEEHGTVIREGAGIVIVNSFDGEEREYGRTDCSIEAEYIQAYPRVFGLLIKGAFYKEAA